MLYRNLTAFIFVFSIGLPAFCEVVTVAFGDRILPFCFPETNTGIELEVIGEALAYRGHTLKPVYYPFARIPVAFNDKLLQGAMTDGGADMASAGAFYGDSTVISFQGANKRYVDWLKPVELDKNYYEKNDQLIQVRMLNLGRYDVVLSDRTIFKYFSNEVQKEKSTKLKPVTMHSFTKVNPSDYRPVFWSKHIRDDFNAGLKNLKATGRFQKIYDKYLNN